MSIKFVVFGMVGKSIKKRLVAGPAFQMAILCLGKKYCLDADSQVFTGYKRFLR
ncbi:hypothetical protein [Pedobacter sp. KACC 23697]|uniref:Uncharacterized protein n=1 Tax=Pedobacter sp. KACC 23697 TaxID=3149230 RepID=A0AAU7K561_9SPHI